MHSRHKCTKGNPRILQTHASVPRNKIVKTRIIYDNSVFASAVKPKTGCGVLNSRLLIPTLIIFGVDGNRATKYITQMKTSDLKFVVS